MRPNRQVLVFHQRAVALQAKQVGVPVFLEGGQVLPDQCRERLSRIAAGIDRDEVLAERRGADQPALERQVVGQCPAREVGALGDPLLVLVRGKEGFFPGCQEVRERNERSVGLLPQPFLDPFQAFAVRPVRAQFAGLRRVTNWS